MNDTVTTTMTDEQASVKNADQFRVSITTLYDAAIGVVLCRSREPHRAIEAIKKMAFIKNQHLHLWNVLSGWQEFNADGGNEEGDGVIDPNGALKKIDGLDGGTAMDDGVFVMMYPHFYLKPGNSIPAMVQALKEYCRSMSRAPNRRLVLVAPPGYTLPNELEEDVSILDFDVPSYAELGEILENQISDTNELLVSSNRGKMSLSTSDTDRILAAAAGMSAHEFESAYTRAIVTHKRSLPDIAIDDLVEEVMKVKIEVVKRSEVLEVMPPANMEEVGGLENLKEWMRKRSRCFSQEARDFGVDAPKGVALIGPPGTGKSLLAKATASLLGLPLIRFDVSRVFQGLVGASEERVRAALKMLDAMAPCVAMLDEVDKAFQTGSGGDSGVSQRVLGLILTHMQESPASIFWVASANRTDNLPAEFLRRGRLDEVFSVNVPDADERLEVLKIHLRKRGKNPDDVPNLSAAVAGSQGYVPAEIEAAVKDAIIDAYTEDVELTGSLISTQLDNMVPLSQAFSTQFSAMEEWAKNNARPASASKKAIEPRKRRRKKPVLVDASRSVDIEDSGDEAS